VAVPTSASAESGGIEWLWGTPILAVPASNSEGINGPMSAYMEGLAATEPPEIRSNRNGAWQSRNKAWLVPESHKKAVGIRKHVKTLRGSILAALHKYFVDHLRLGVEPVGRRGNASSIGEPPAVEVTIDASWANVNPPCSINGPHVHPFSVVSGAYYVDCGGDAGNSSEQASRPCEINLMDPRPSAPMAQLPAEVRDALDMGIDWTLSLWPGTILLFPSWLTHWVPPNAAGKSRKTISFNAGVRLAGPGG